jgi:hypothetical protein
MSTPNQPNTETLDKLYLEWGQFTQVRTKREMKVRKGLTKVVAQMETRQVETVTPEEWRALIRALLKLRLALN